MGKHLFANIVGSIWQIQLVLNWANACFANIVRVICRTMFGVQKAALNMFWEYSPSSTNLVSDWLRAESSPVDEEEIKIKMFRGEYFVVVDLWAAQPCLWDQNEIRVS